MPLRKQKGNMYTDVTHTFNTIKGKCPHDCKYCYMKRWGGFNSVRFDKKECRTDLGNGNFIFVGSSNDMFAESISPDWIKSTLGHLRKFDNSYLLQSKNPEGILKYSSFIPEKTVLCTTAETNRYYPVWMGCAPKPLSRASPMERLTGFTKYVTIEPVLDFDLEELVNLIKKCAPEQVNIGADSGGHNMPEPSREKVLQLVGELSIFTRVIKKNNLKRIL